MLAASQFVVQSLANPDEPGSGVLLTVGYVAPPLILGTPEEQQTALAALDHVNVRPIARFAFSIGKAAELAQIIQDVVHRMEAGGQQS